MVIAFSEQLFGILSPKLPVENTSRRDARSEVLFYLFHYHSTFKTLSDSSSIAPSHIQQAKAALRDAGILVAISQQVLDLATAFYHASPR